MVLARAPGTDGVISVGGYLVDGERRPELRGSTRWVTYDNLLANVTIIASAVGIWLDLAGSSKWSPVPNPLGGADAVLAAEIVQAGLLDARMATRWRNVVKRQGMKKFRGFAMHAKGWRRRADGLIVLAELAHRPQWSIERWLKPSESEPWIGVVQRSRTGVEVPIERADLFYSHEGSIGDSPDGVGLFRHLAEVAEIFNRYRQLQGIAFDTDCNGIPIGRAPLGELYKQAIASTSEGGGGIDATDTAAITAYVRSRAACITDLIEKRVKTTNQSLLLDSLPYFTTRIDGTVQPSTIMKWGLDTVRQQIGSLPELGKALFELNTEMARVMSCEWLLLDGSGGAYALSADKTNMFALRVNACLDDLGDDTERDIIPDLLARNGITDERLFPSLQHEPVSRTSALTAADMLVKIAAAKLKPGDPAENVLRERAELPPAPEPDADIAAWRAGRSGGGPAAKDPVDDEAKAKEDKP